ncbi:hypothetical protein ACFLY6_02005 [Candidatus Dependentiae bacterium]
MQHDSKPLDIRLKHWFISMGKEILYHIPYGITAVFVSMIFIWLFSCKFSFSTCCLAKGHSHINDSLFCMLHYAHIFFAGITSVLSFRRHYGNILGAVMVGLTVPPIFCTLSDVIFPYIGGLVMGVKMQLHLCALKNFWHFLPMIFLGVGVGLILSTRKINGGISLIRFACGSHFLHELVSASASLVYLASFGCINWWASPLSVFVLLTISVIVPCTLSDVVVPIFCAWLSGKEPPQNSGCCCHRCD